ncbi:MAG: PDZ domain-containing protein [Ruminococcaceae bacterium]|nr:PDZ domain-containing protein [Oscillospiraceae bacterium]
MQRHLNIMKGKRPVLSVFFVLLILTFSLITASAEENEKEVYIGGFPFGVKIETQGVIVSDIREIDSNVGKVCPAKDAGFKPGDIITSVSDKKVNSAGEVADIIANSKGKILKVQVERGDKKLSLNLVPVLTSDKKSYKTGLYIKDSAAGIGTVTFVLEDKRTFGGLGHGISDRNTQRVLPLKTGSVHPVIINNVIKGSNTVPGELKGSLDAQPNGTLLKNTEMGVFGTFNKNLENLEKIKVGNKNEVKEGKCTIYTCLDKTTRSKIEGEIVSIVDKNSKTKNFIISLTDKETLKKTGGIVQGMSGSPITQNGKLVGAVTHVCVNL